MEIGTFRSLDGKIAIVTGGGNGIGRSISIDLAKRGCSVAVVDIEEQAGFQTVHKIETMGCNAIFIPVDVSNSAEVNEMTKRTINLFTRIDILVNNAGICLPNLFETIDDDEWSKVINTNLTGTFNCCRSVLGSMKARKQGNIVNISSLAARWSSPLCGAHYTASKAGILGLTRHLAKEVASFGIRVNAICPGAIKTRVQTNLQTPEDIKNKAREIPIGRIGEPEEVAEVVAFLASDSASYITGATIDINGGVLMI